MDQEDARRRSVSGLLPLVLPAVLVGIGSALALIALSLVSGELQKFLYDWLPPVFGASGESGWWIFLVLTACGLVVGLVVWKVPGHAGPDPATTSLVSAPLGLGVLPSLALTIVIGLGAGVSLGPENPIIAINIALTVALLARFVPGVPVPTAVMLAVAATLGAMFGTPVAAALLLTELPSRQDGGQLWDRLFAPLVAAGAAALTMVLFHRPVLSVSVPAYGEPRAVDLLTGTGVALVAVGVGLCALYAFPLVHRVFRALGNPVVALTAGGMVLGLLGALGGTVTMFKGLDEMKELTSNAGSESTGYLVAVAGIKLLALIVAASCGFRGAASSRQCSSGSPSVWRHKVRSAPSRRHWPSPAGFSA